VQYRWVLDQALYIHQTAQFEASSNMWVGLFIPVDFITTGRAGEWIRSDCATAKPEGSCPTIRLELWGQPDVDDEFALDGTVAASGVSWSTKKVRDGYFTIVTEELLEPYRDGNVTLNPYTSARAFMWLWGGGDAVNEETWVAICVYASADTGGADSRTFVDRTTTTAALKFQVISLDGLP